MTGPHPLEPTALADDVYLRHHVGTDPAGRLWRVPGAVAVAVPRDGTVGVVGLGDPGRIPDAVAETAATLGDEGMVELRLSLPPGVEAPAVERVGDVNLWEWMWTARPTGAAIDGVGWLGTADDPDLRDLLDHSPRAHARPGDDHVRGWAGVRRAGRLVAAGALTRAPAGTPHLRAIVTHPDHRGHGLGAAVTAYLTDAGLRSGPVVTLGMYSDNDGARRLYHRLGYVTSHRWASSRARLARRDA